MKFQVLRAGVLGASGFGRYHAREFASFGCEVCAILGSSEESARRTSQMLHDSWGINATPYFDLEELLNKENLDAVSICTPPKFHEKQIRICLENDVDVMCEKPLILEGVGRNYQMAKKLFRLAENLCRILTANLQWPSVLDVLPAPSPPIDKFMMYMEPGVEGINMLRDSLAHTNSMLIRLFPRGNSSNIRFSEKVGSISIRFDYLTPNANCEVEYIFTHNPLRPRKVYFSLNDTVWERQISEDYKQAFLSDGKTLPIEDPLRISIGCFLSAIVGRGNTLVSKEEILENLRLQDEIVSAYEQNRK